MEDLQEIVPQTVYEAICPKCGHTYKNPKKNIFFGLHFLAAYNCDGCSCSFFKTLPQGHGSVFPITVTEDLASADYDPRAKGWLTEPLFKSLEFPSQGINVPIERKVNSKKSSSIVINCLDTCYGHIFYKIVSILYYLNKYPNYGIIVLIPKSIEWMCPEGISEKWLVDVPVKLLGHRLTTLDEFIHKCFLEFDKISIARQYMNPDFEKVNFEKLLKVKRFNLDNFTNHPYTICFVLREDRFWHSNKLERFFWKASLKLRVAHIVKTYFVYRQNAKVKRLSEMLSEKFSNIVIYATGIGVKGTLGKNVIDLRRELGKEDPMYEWRSIFASSHIVIGVHGSQLLVPTALSAGFIEICSEDKICHISEEIAMVHHPKYMHFLGRFVGETCSVKLLYKHAQHMLSDFEFIKINY